MFRKMSVEIQPFCSPLWNDETCAVCRETPAANPPAGELGSAHMNSSPTARPAMDQVEQTRLSLLGHLTNII